MQLRMESELSQQQTIGLRITTHMLQSLDVLHMSTAQLTEYVNRQIADNPLLELAQPRSRFRARHMDDERLRDLADRSSWTMEEELLAQLRLLPLSDGDYRIAAFLAGSLDDNGWLTLTLEEAARVLREPPAKVAQALSAVQALEPAGIAARSLSECLLLQIARDPAADPLAAAVAQDHLPALADGQWSRIASRLGVPLERLEQAARYIGGLQPRPGTLCGGAGAWTASVQGREQERDRELIIPDAYIVKHGSDYVVHLNDALFPRVALQEEALLPPAREAAAFWRPFQRSAHALLSSLEQRQHTLLLVLQAMVAEQRPYLDHGPAALTPMTLSTIAAAVELHPSTISRAIANKYVSTSHGTHALKSWFTSGVERQDGTTASSAAIKAAIARHIAAEDAMAPLSDARLASLLADEGIPVARRTIMKYREAMRIPSSRRRSSAR